jgi:hypothetical protein
VAIHVDPQTRIQIPSGEWSDDDYDVFDGDRHIGRIVWSYAAPSAAIPKN